MKSEEITVEHICKAFEDVMQAATREGQRLALESVVRPSVRNDQFLEVRKYVTDSINAFQHTLVTIGTDKCAASYHQLLSIHAELLMIAKRKGEDEDE